MIMEIDGCHLIFAKVTNPNVIKVAAKSHILVTHQIKVIGRLIRS